MRIIRPTLAVAVFAALGGCGAGGHDFHRELAKHNLELPATVTVNDFRNVCVQSSVTDPNGLLESIKIKVRGKGDEALLHTVDLLRACGPECRIDDGALGTLLAKFAVDIHRR